MSFQFVSFAVAVFVAAVVLMVVGGFGEIEAFLRRGAKADRDCPMMGANTTRASDL
jgi:hypothetical protein